MGKACQSEEHHAKVLGQDMAIRMGKESDGPGAWHEVGGLEHGEV